MTPFYAKFQGYPVMVIAIVAGSGHQTAAPKAIFIHGDGQLDHTEVHALRIDLTGQWRPAEWPSWPVEPLVLYDVMPA